MPSYRAYQFGRGSASLTSVKGNASGPEAFKIVMISKTISALTEVGKVQNNNIKDRFSRRGFIGIGSAALATVAGSLAVSGAVAQEGQQTHKTQTDRSATDPGPENMALDGQNP